MKARKQILVQDIAEEKTMMNTEEDYHMTENGNREKTTMTTDESENKNGIQSQNSGAGNRTGTTHTTRILIQKGHMKKNYALTWKLQKIKRKLRKLMKTKWK